MFARYWGFIPKACRPYRARTKGKDERGVGYVKTNAVAGREFASWQALEAHLEHWSREVADVRIHGTTGEQPVVRFQREVVARHGRVAANRRHRSVLRGHWDGLVPAPQQDLAERSLPSADGASCVGSASVASPPCGGGTRRRAAVVRSSELARSLAVYAAEVGEEVAA